MCFPNFGHGVFINTCRLFGMVRQTPAICAALVFNSNGLKDFKGPKYHFPDSPTPSLTGINSYPFMVAVPYVRMSSVELVEGYLDLQVSFHRNLIFTTTEQILSV